jgi:hypothetical protein
VTVRLPSPVIVQELREACHGRARVAKAEGAGEGEVERGGRDQEKGKENRGGDAGAHMRSLKHMR